MQKKVGKIPSILCPIKNRTMLDNLVEQYDQKVDKIAIVGYKKINLIRDYIQYKKYDIDVFELDTLNDLGYTIKYGMECIYKKYSDVDGMYINFADTLITDQFNFEMTDIIFYSTDYIGEEWTYFKHNQNGELTEIWDKVEFDLPCKDTLNLFIGVFYITNAACFLSLLQNTDVQLPAINCDSFYKAVFLYSQAYSMTYVYTDTWLDVGHTENYFSARTGVEARIFNTIEADKGRGILKNLVIFTTTFFFRLAED